MLRKDTVSMGHLSQTSSRGCQDSRQAGPEASGQARFSDSGMLTGTRALKES